jgi:hypothetical protein
MPEKAIAQPAPALRTQLTTDAEALNKRFVTLWTAIFQIIEQFSPPGHHGQQTPTGMMVLLMRLKMLGKL